MTKKMLILAAATVILGLGWTRDAGAVEKIYQVSCDNVSWSDIVTVPAGKKLIVRTIVLSNPGSAGIGIAMLSIDNSGYFLSAGLPPYGTFAHNFTRVVIPAGKTLMCLQGSGAGPTFTAQVFGSLVKK